VNRAQLTKTIGQHVRLRPEAKGPRGEPVDDDWLVRAVDDRRVELVNQRSGDLALVGLDHVYGYDSNPQRDTDAIKYGFLKLHVEVTLTGRDVRIEPLPSPKTERGVRFKPLIVRDGNTERFFSWRDRDPIHLVRGEEPPRQLLEFFVPLCDALRTDAGKEPEFNLPDDLRGEIVYELSPDMMAKWRLMGGSGGKPGKAILVLTSRPARQTSETIKSPRIEPVVRRVDLEYPSRSGLQGQLEADGYRVTWRRDDKPRDDDAKPVVIDDDGEEFVLKVKDPHSPLTLFKKRLR